MTAREKERSELVRRGWRVNTNPPIEGTIDRNEYYHPLFDIYTHHRSAVKLQARIGWIATT